MKLLLHKKTIGIMIVVLSLIFLIVHMWGLDFSILSGLKFSPGTMTLSLVIALCFRFWGIIIWRTILTDLGAKSLPSFSVMALIYAKAWMARYIPGTIASLAGKVVLASNMGISKSRLTVASLMEAGVQIVAIATASMIVLLWDGRILNLASQHLLAIFVLTVILMGTLLAPPVFNPIVRTIYSKIRGHGAYPELASNYLATIRSFVSYLIGFAISGSAYFFLCSSLYPQTNPNDWMYIIAAVNLAAVIGMATPFVPSGLGVRDVSLLALLSVILPKEIALVITIVSRFWSIAADIFFYGLTTCINFLTKNNLTESQKSV